MPLDRPAPAHAADELTTLRTFLDYFRITLRRQSEGLGSEQLAATLPPSTMTLGGLLKHLAFVEQWWFQVVLHGRTEVGIWADVDWSVDEDWDWHTAGDHTPAELDALLVEEIARSDVALDEALADGGLDRLSVRSSHGEHVSVRWILVHMIEEYARHCGHADLLRESIDGATDI